MLALVFRYSDNIMKLFTTGFGSIVTVTTVSRTLVDEKKRRKKWGKLQNAFLKRVLIFTMFKVYQSLEDTYILITPNGLTPIHFRSLTVSHTVRNLNVKSKVFF